MTITLSLRSRKYRSIASLVSRKSSGSRNIAFEFIVAIVLVAFGTPPIRGINAPCCVGGLGGDCANPGKPYGILYPYLPHTHKKLKISKHKNIFKKIKMQWNELLHTNTVVQFTKLVPSRAMHNAIYTIIMHFVMIGPVFGKPTVHLQRTKIVLFTVDNRQCFCT